MTNQRGRSEASGMQTRPSLGMAWRGLPVVLGADLKSLYPHFPHFQINRTGNYKVENLPALTRKQLKFCIAIKTNIIAMWGFGWGSFAVHGAAGAARCCRTGAAFLSYRSDETERKGSRPPRCARVGPRDGRAPSLSTGIGLVGLARSGRTVSGVYTYVELAGRDQMTNTDDF